MLALNFHSWVAIGCRGSVDIMDYIVYTIITDPETSGNRA